MKRVFLSTTLLVLFTSCDTLSESSLPSGQIELCADLTGDHSQESRVAITPSESSDVWAVEWAEGDALGCYSPGSGAESFSKFTMSTFDKEASIFTGSAMGDLLRMVHPYSGDSAAISSDLYNIDLSEQSCDMNTPFELLGQNTHMISSELYPSDDHLSVSMMHVGAALSFNICFQRLQSNDENITSFKLARVEVGIEDEDITTTSLNYAQLPMSGDIDLAKGVDDTNFYSHEKMGSIAVNVLNSPDLQEYDGGEQTVYSVYFNTFPFVIARGEVLALKWYVHCYNADGEVYREWYTKDKYVVNNSESDLLFARSTHNSIDVVCNGEFYRSITITAGIE